MSIHIERLAKKLRVQLRWFEDAEGFKKLMSTDQREQPRGNSSLITKMVYYGHGKPGKLMIAYAEVKKNKEAYVDAEIFEDSYYAHNPTIHLVTCHSASRPEDENNKSYASLAERIRNKIGSGSVFGYDGRVDYAPVANGYLPIPGTSIDLRHVAEDPSRRERGRQEGVEYHVEKVGFK